MLNIQMHGLEELSQIIKQYADADRITEKALNEGADVFKQALEKEVYRHGLTRRSGKSVDSFVIDTRIVNGSIRVGLSNQDNDAFYLYFHEWGTSLMPARPFMRPAFEIHQGKIIIEMAKVIRRELGL